MFSFTAYPYPKSESYKEILISSTAAGILIYLFLIIFQPFGTENFHHHYKYLLLLPYGIIFWLAFFTADLTVIRFKDWNIGSELLKTVIILFLASVAAYFYNTLFLSRVAISFINYVYMFLYAAALGIPIAAIYILSRFIYLKSIYEKQAEEVSRHLSASHEIKQNASPKILIIPAGKTELQIPADHFICAQSMENYCTIYFSENNDLKKIIIRISLSGLLNQIQTNSIKKCHRSYIANLEKVYNIKGNAQGYRLFLSGIDFEIPVSRSFIPQIIPQLNT
ncbi:LytTR family DNA-binding domain-containing protein [uncultured Chryseobacterium sp.]|uniref:LytTR family DNA-binding domain-containing protein n=1 Tax=uncultured Chryseobacterium sp. TaxID=259322 RepID=UPI0025FB4FC8|nr:LytTR family DNA-binding domain-containing protein [uncultured Chryseobacterium sp.]